MTDLRSNANLGRQPLTLGLTMFYVRVDLLNLYSHRMMVIIQIASKN